MAKNGVRGGTTANERMGGGGSCPMRVPKVTMPKGTAPTGSTSPTGRPQRIGAGGSMPMRKVRMSMPKGQTPTKQKRV